LLTGIFHRQVAFLAAEASFKAPLCVFAVFVCDKLQLLETKLLISA